MHHVLFCTSTCQERPRGHSAPENTRAFERGWHRGVLSDLQGRPTGRTCPASAASARSALPRARYSRQNIKKGCQERPAGPRRVRAPAPTRRSGAPRIARWVFRWWARRGSPLSAPSARSAVPTAGGQKAAFRRAAPANAEGAPVGTPRRQARCCRGRGAGRGAG